MRVNSLKAIVNTALRGAAVLLVGAGVASAQQAINLSAGPTTATLPDGNCCPDVGLFLRCCRRDRNGDLRQPKSRSDRLVPRRDHCTRGDIGVDQHHNHSHQQSHIWDQCTPNLAHHSGPVWRWPWHDRDEHAQPGSHQRAIGHVADCGSYDHGDGSAPGKSRTVVLHRSSGWSNHVAYLDLSAAGHISD